MSKIKLKHSSGNSVSIAAPQSNPDSDRTLYVPSNADGTILTTTSPKAGNIIQVLQTEKLDTASSASGTYATILSQQITRSSTSNGVLISFTVYVSSTASSVPVIGFNIVRDSTNIAQSSGSPSIKATTLDYLATNSMSRHTVEFYDETPGSTNPITYNIQWARLETGTAYLGRYHGSDDYHAPSYLILKEVAA